METDQAIVTLSAFLKSHPNLRLAIVEGLIASWRSEELGMLLLRLGPLMARRIHEENAKPVRRRRPPAPPNPVSPEEHARIAAGDAYDELLDRLEEERPRGIRPERWGALIVGSLAGITDGVLKRYGRTLSKVAEEARARTCADVERYT